MQAPHPLGVAAGQVVVDRDDMHALAGKRVQIGRQRVATSVLPSPVRISAILPCAGPCRRSTGRRSCRRSSAWMAGSNALMRARRSDCTLDQPVVAAAEREAEIIAMVKLVAQVRQTLVPKPRSRGRRRRPGRNR